MTEISDAFVDLKNKNEAALIAYVTVGDPNANKTPGLVSALIEGGVDIVELGIPFSDPIADGPTIQNAVSRSLASGCKPIDAFDVASTIRERYEISTRSNDLLQSSIQNRACSISETWKKSRNFGTDYTRSSDRRITELQERVCVK